MLVVKGVSKQPMMLLTSLPYIRVLKYQRLRNIMALLLAVFYFIAVRMDTQEKLKILVTHVLKQAKRVFGVPDFKYYALSDDMSALFKRAPGNQTRRQNSSPGPPQQLIIELW